MSLSRPVGSVNVRTLDSIYIMNAQPSFVDATYKITKRARSQALSPPSPNGEGDRSSLALPT